MANPVPVQNAKTEDKRIERLYDYTKFHIGIYLSAAGALASLISVLSTKDTQLPVVLRHVRFPWLLGLSFLAMMLAGVAGAIVATSAIQCAAYDDFVEMPQGAFGCTPFTGKTWTSIEHGAFWFSLVSLAVAVFSSRQVLEWLGTPVWVTAVVVLGAVLLLLSAIARHFYLKNSAVQVPSEAKQPARGQ